MEGWVVIGVDVIVERKRGCFLALQSPTWL